MWNFGILGLKSGRRHFIQIMLNLHLLIMFVRHPSSAFISKIFPSNEKIDGSICAWILYFLKPIIPLFHHSNWGEAPNLCPVRN